MARAFWVLADGARDTIEEFAEQEDAEQYALQQAEKRLATRFSIVELHSWTEIRDTAIGLEPRIATVMDRPE